MAVQAPQLYFSDNLCAPNASMITAVQQQDWNYPVAGLDDIFSSLPSPQPHQDHNFHLGQALEDQYQSTIGFDCCNQLGFSASTADIFFSESLSAQLEFQRHDLDCIIQLQSEKLRFALHEQRKQQLLALLNNLESRMLSLTRQKEENLAQATKKSMELQNCLRKAEVENDAWQRVAKANEAMVVTLNNRLAKVRERLVSGSAEADDAESSCSGSGDNRGNRAVNMEEENDRAGKKLKCKSCKTRRSCVLFLPCRHLCSCKFCEAFLGSCPVCGSTKEASMEVFLV